MVSVLVLAACNGDGGEDGDAQQDDGGQETLKIGFASGQTGYLAVTDGPALEGLEFGFEEINEEGGIAGRLMVELDVRNTESDPGLTATTVEALIEDGADIIVTPCDSDPSVAGGQVSQREGIPTFSICASTPTMRDQVGDMMFGNTYGDNVSGSILAGYARELGYETAYLHLSTDTQYTQRLPEYFAIAFEEMGGEVIDYGTYAIDQQDFSAGLTELANVSPPPDVFFTSTYEPQLQALLQQYQNQGIETHFFAAEGMDTPASFELPDEAIEGVVYTTASFVEPGGPLEEFNQKYEEHYGREPGSAFPAIGYDLAQVIKAAVEEAGSIEGEAIRDAVLLLEGVQGGTGEISYTGREDGMATKSVALVEVRNGEPQLIRFVSPDPAEIPDATATWLP